MVLKQIDLLLIWEISCWFQQLLSHICWHREILTPASSTLGQSLHLWQKSIITNHNHMQVSYSTYSLWVKLCLTTYFSVWQMSGWAKKGNISRLKPLMLRHSLKFGAAFSHIYYYISYQLPEEVHHIHMQQKLNKESQKTSHDFHLASLSFKSTTVNISFT